MQTATDLQIRQLPPEEWPRLLAFEPFASGGIPPAEHWRILVAEEAGQIVGFTCLYTAVHFEPIWIDPSHRHQPGLFAELWRASKTILDEYGVQLLFVQVPDTLPQQKRLVERFGFVAAPGQLYIGEVEKVGV